MEDVYVIKVKTKPPISSLYPSERRYSASTVGGLALVHFGLGALALLLGTLARTLQGPILSLACLVPFVAGMLAWRRWYIDRNIGIFFYASLFSLIAAVLCLVATVFDIAAAAEGGASSPWRLENIFASPEEFVRTRERSANVSLARYNDSDVEDERVPRTFPRSDYEREKVPEPVRDRDTPRSAASRALTGDEKKNASGVDRYRSDRPEGEGFADPEDLRQEPSLLYERTARPHGTRGGNATLEVISDGVVSFWHADTAGVLHSRLLLGVNVLVACLLEAFWSMLSARISLRGMTNRLAEPGYHRGCATAESKVARPGQTTKKPRAPRPDLLNHSAKRSGSVQSLNSLPSLQGSGPRLPLPESSREFRERVERFLANQAAHRVVEGSCS